MFQRILVPLDGSTRAERAIPVAARIARASKGSMIFLRVVTTPLEERDHKIHPSPLTKAVMDADIAAANYLTALTALDNLDGIGITTKVLLGNAAPTILDVTREEQVDLIVMCSHGEAGLKRWVVGSVAHKVAQQSPVPVLVLPKDGPLPTSSYPDPSRPLRSLMGLVALDGSAFAEAALVPAATLVTALAAPARGILLLTKVVTLPAPDTKRVHREHIDPQLKEQVLEDANMYLDGVKKRLLKGPVADLKLEIRRSVVVSMDIADALLKDAENSEDAEGMHTLGGCDLIAIATHGRGGRLPVHIKGAVLTPEQIAPYIAFQGARATILAEESPACGQAGRVCRVFWRQEAPSLPLTLFRSAKRSAIQWQSFGTVKSGSAQQLCGRDPSQIARFQDPAGIHTHVHTILLHSFHHSQRPALLLWKEALQERSSIVLPFKTNQPLHDT